MAVGVESLWEDSPSTKPDDGKFRVKGTAHGKLPAALFLYRNAPQGNEAGAFRRLRYVPASPKLFSLGRTVAITDNVFP